MKINTANIIEVIRTLQKTTILVYRDGSRQEFNGAIGLDMFRSLTK